jgi:hypothetical protein
MAGRRSEIGSCLRKFMILTVVMMVVSLSAAQVAAKGGHVTTDYNRKLYVTVLKVESFDWVDGVVSRGAGDFYWKIRVVAGHYDVTEESDWETYENIDPVYPRWLPYWPETPWRAIFDVPDNARDIDVYIELWDADRDDPYPYLDPDDLCDISGSDSDVHIVFSTVTRTWSGDDYEGDPNGYGFVSGEEDGSTGTDQDDCGLWFSVLDKGTTMLSDMVLSLRDAQGNYIGGTVEIWAATAELGTYEAPPEDGFLLKTIETTDGYDGWYLGTSTTLMLWAKAPGYWDVRVVVPAMYEGSYGFIDFRLIQNTVDWVPLVVMFADVDWTHTTITYSYEVGYSSTLTADDYALGTGKTNSISNTVTVRGETNSDIFYDHNGVYPTSSIYRSMGEVSGIYWGETYYDVARMDNAWLMDDVTISETYPFMEDYWDGTYRSGSTLQRVYAGESKEFEKEGYGEVTLQYGLEISFSVGVPGFSVGGSLVSKLSDTSTSYHKLCITIFNDDFGTYHDYRLWLEGGVIMHVYELGQPD